MRVVWLGFILKNKFAKGHEPNWSSTGYKVVGMRESIFDSKYK